MKYETTLILRIIFALLIRPEIFFYTLLIPTMAFPYFVVKLFGYNVSFLLSANTLLVNNEYITFVEACIATSAYYLLVLLLFTTKGIGLRKGIMMFFVGSVLIFVMNALRITLLMLIVISLGLNWYNAIHLAFWFIVSTVYVFLVWIFLIKLFNVKTIPVYSDVMYLLSHIKKEKK